MNGFDFSSWSIRNPVPPILLFVVLMVLGLMSFGKLPVTRFPNIDIPLVAINVVDPGVAPRELETQTTKIIEDAVSNVTGVKNVISTLTEGVSTTVAEFRLEVDTQTAVNDIKDAVERIQADLPATANEPIISRIDIEGAAILTYSVNAPAMTLEELSWFVDDTIIRDLQGVKGIARVSRYGGVEREIKVEIDPDRLKALGVTASDVNNAIRSLNIDLTGGRGDIAGREQSIRTLGGANSIEDLQRLRIALPTGVTVQLDEIATVKDGFTEQRSFALTNGTPVVAFAIFRGKGQSDVEVKERVVENIAALQETFPDVAINLVDDTVTYTAGNYESAMATLIEGALLATIVVLLFLGDFRATLIAAAALPLSIIPTFWVLDSIGFSLNLVSLLGITLVTGILVDDVIVEIENVIRHMNMGKTPYKASKDAAKEIGLAVIAISATIIAVFVPVSFMSGIAGQYFKQFGITVAVAVFFSLLVARLITPMMCAFLLRPHKEIHEEDGLLNRAFTWFLGLTIGTWTRWITVAVAVVMFMAAGQVAGTLPSGFIPKEDQSRFVMAMELPPGTKIDGTREKAREVTEVIDGIEGVESVYIVGGANPTGSLDIRLGTITVDLFHKSERDIPQEDIEQELFDRLSNISDTRFYKVDDRGEREFAFRVIGDEGADIEGTARKIQAEMERSGIFTGITSNAALDKPEIIVKPRMDKLVELGLSTAAISQALRVATLGDVDTNLAKFTIGDRQIPIRVQLDPEARADLSVIKSLSVLTPQGISVPLSSVADITFGQGPSSIIRFNRQRQIILGASMKKGFEIGAGTDFVQGLDIVKNMPEGVRIGETGNAEIQGDVETAFVGAMITGIMLVFVVLILLFGNIFQTFTILMSLPLSFGGVVAGLWLSNNALSMPVFIGILMLMGIVTKNAIMLVDFAIEREREGMSKRDAIIDASSKRARPIIMTTIAMSAGMLPAALAIGDGGEFRAPMAIAVIGGLLVSTVLSLVFVPSIYSIMDTLSKYTGIVLRFIIRPNEAEEDDDNLIMISGRQADLIDHDPKQTKMLDQQKVISGPAE